MFRRPLRGLTLVILAKGFEQRQRPRRPAFSAEVDQLRLLSVGSGQATVLPLLGRGS